MIFFEPIYVVEVLEHDKNIKNKKNLRFDHFSQFSKKWRFLATFGKIALSQRKRIQKKIGLVRIRKG